MSVQKAKRILIIGNGFGGVYALKSLHNLFHNDPNVHITLVGENNYFLFTPLLHEVATGGISPENIIEPLQKVLGCCLDTFHMGKATKINLAAHTVEVGEAVLAYDYLILAPGAETNFYGTPGAEQYSLPLKTLQHAIAIKNRAITQVEQASYVLDREVRRRMLTFVVVGGGPTGVELAAELAEFVKDTFAHYYSKEVIADISIIVVQKGSELLTQFDTKLRTQSFETLIKKGVAVMLGTAVSEVGADYIKVNDTQMIPTETVIWVAGVKPASLNFDTEVTQAPDGKLVTNEYLQLKRHSDVFVIGDLASVVSASGAMPLPALAQVAVKEGAFVATNIQMAMNGKPLRPFVYKSSGGLVSLGQWMAVGEINHIYFSGRIAWWIWRTVYLSKLISWQKKLGVMFDWTLDLFSARDISKL
jgi:NADH:ubiquinone reductase (H+-translocating)